MFKKASLFAFLVLLPAWVVFAGEPVSVEFESPSVVPQTVPDPPHLRLLSVRRYSRVYKLERASHLWTIFSTFEPRNYWLMADWKALAAANPHLPKTKWLAAGSIVLVPNRFFKQTVAAPLPSKLAAVAPQIKLAPAPPAEPFRLRLISFLYSNENLPLALLLTMAISALVLIGTDIRFMKWVLVPLSVYLGGSYLFWRAHTLNLSTPLASIPSLLLYGAEIFGFVSMALYFFQVMKLSQRVSPPVDEDHLPTVDVFVTIFNEPAEILYKTLVGCLALDYPSEKLKIYVLDDGGRAEIHDLARQFGVLYIARPNHDHAKSGNVNFALKLSSGEFIMMLDCDHVPVRSFLKETMGFFKYPKVAFVQTPHHFYNSDTYQHNLRIEQDVVNEQELFFQVLQPGKDAHNSSFYSGSSGVFRRKPLEEIGGFQTDSLIEDLHTSMALHSKGWRSVYLRKTLSGALSPETYDGYLRQRQRWTRGGIQVMLKDNPLIKRGLTFAQRVNYFASTLYFFHGIPRAIYLIAPLGFTLFAVAPMTCSAPALLAYFIPYYVAGVLAFTLTSQEFRNPFWSDVYESVVCFFLTGTAIDTLLRPWKRDFDVTPKGVRNNEARMDWARVSPHLILLGLLGFGSSLCFWRAWHGLADSGAAFVSVGWAVYNAIILVNAIVVARTHPQLRAAHRLERRVPCELLFNNRKVSGVTEDVSETGFSLKLERHALLPKVVGVRILAPWGEVTEVAGTVVRNIHAGAGARIGIRFAELSEEQRQSLIRQMFSGPESWARDRRENLILPSLWLMLTAWARFLITRKPIQRKSLRVRQLMDCELVASDGVHYGLLKDISSSGMSLQTEAPAIDSPLVVRLHPRGEKESVEIQAKIVRREHTRDHGTTLLGLQFLEQKDEQLAALL